MTEVTARALAPSELPTPTTQLTFPPGFLWGSATSALSSEGGLWNTDFWEWEVSQHLGWGLAGDAADHYHRWDEDLSLLASLGQRSFRFSLDWSRIEPEPGQFSRAALDHYACVLDGLAARNMVGIVTLHHFASPRWLAKEGTWLWEKAPERFGEFAEIVAKRLGPRIEFVETINEPNMLALSGYHFGLFPPGRTDANAYVQVTRNLIAAHAAGSQAFREYAPHAKIMLALATDDWQAVDVEAGPVRDGIYERLVGVHLDAVRTGSLTALGIQEEIPPAAGSCDFVGVHYYSRRVIDSSPTNSWVVDLPGAGSVAMAPAPAGAETFTGLPDQPPWEIYPEGLTHVLQDLGSRTGLPLYVTENGISTQDEGQRISFIARHLAAVKKALDLGIDVRGYGYWCSFDDPVTDYGLIAVDSESFQRTPKVAAHYFADIAKANAVDPQTTARYLDKLGAPAGGQHRT